MSAPSLHTVELHNLVDRMRAGDRAAADDLLRMTSARLERLARKMLGAYPAARRQADTQDVLQGALIRLVRSLGAVRPDSTRSFFNLAAVQMRRELLDLGRAAARRPRFCDLPPDGSEAEDRPADRSDTDLDRWARLHTAVEELPVVEREVFSLIFYHRWKQAQIAELLGVSARQVRRLWADACNRLRAAVGGVLPAA
jgi:RNA polymerase sigma factor (sigma-70 family)